MVPDGPVRAAPEDDDDINGGASDDDGDDDADDPIPDGAEASVAAEDDSDVHSAEDGSDVHVTHRPATIDPDAKDDYFRPVPLPASIERHRFDLADPESWSALPPASSISSVVITFPLNLPAAENFWGAYLRHVPRVVCYSSTSVYQVDVPGQRAPTPRRDETVRPFALQHPAQPRQAGGAAYNVAEAI